MGESKAEQREISINENGKEKKYLKLESRRIRTCAVTHCGNGLWFLADNLNTAP
jgi:hypothetical protein